MKTKIELSTNIRTIPASDMRDGDWGVVKEPAYSFDGHVVYCHRVHGSTTKIIDMTTPGTQWSENATIRIRLCALGESVTVTRIE